MTHQPKFCVLCGFMDDGTEANALSVNGRCPFCEQAYHIVEHWNTQTGTDDTK